MSSAKPKTGPIMATSAKRTSIIISSITAHLPQSYNSKPSKWPGGSALAATRRDHSSISSATISEFQSQPTRESSNAMRYGWWGKKRLSKIISMVFCKPAMSMFTAHLPQSYNSTPSRSLDESLSLASPKSFQPHSRVTSFAGRHLRRRSSWGHRPKSPTPG